MPRPLSKSASAWAAPPSHNEYFSRPPPLSQSVATSSGGSSRSSGRAQQQRRAGQEQQQGSQQQRNQQRQRLLQRGAGTAMERASCVPCHEDRRRNPPRRPLDRNERFLQRLQRRAAEMEAQAAESSQYFRKVQLRQQVMLKEGEEKRERQAAQAARGVVGVRRFKPTRIPLWVPDTWTVVCEQRKDDRPPPPPPKPPPKPPPGSKRAKELAEEKKRPPRPAPEPPPPVVAPVITDFLFYPPGGLKPVRSVAEAIKRGLLHVNDVGILERCRNPNHTADTTLVVSKRDL